MASVTLDHPAAQNPASLWRNRTFLAIWLGHMISILGDGFHSVALGLWVLQTTGSAKAMASVMTVRLIVGVLLGAVAGTAVDRSDRRKLMIATDVIRFALVGGVAVLVARPGTPFAAVLLLTGLISVCSQFFNPAFQASLVNIVGKDEVPKATSLLQLTNTLTMVVAPVLGGTVVGLWGGWAALVADAASFLLSALLILAGGTFASPRNEGEQRSFLTDLKAGFGYIRTQPLVRSIVALAPVINFFAAAFQVLFPVIVVKLWLASAVQFGSMETFFTLGFALGAAALMALSTRLRRRGWWMLGGIIVAGALISVMSLVHSIPVAFGLMLLMGLSLAFPNLILQMTLQAEVPTDVQGRVFGTLSSLCNVASPAAMLIAGILGDWYSPLVILATSGLLLVGSAVTSSVFSAGLRDYN
ncbi:MAG TPA: MFS transporter [Symbiobacteriaceae bacterium]|nr:MFS transporter [Symbiobacteriaceae bacterium]